MNERLSVQKAAISSEGLRDENDTVLVSCMKKPDQLMHVHFIHVASPRAWSAVCYRSSPSVPTASVASGDKLVRKLPRQQ
ncbi:hypothetical protein CEXT_452731 [Caerostris extrusa]|uniref:Uncharacterized protein n=1 Tax=Caerostris extrusa TaxID=172846 RepID=A0AAV4RJH2_CAEEX|nr:hypothetical protein CEXT_452731 [Caerostris extrusa]